MTKDDAARAALDRHPDCSYAEVIEGAHLADPVWIVCLWASARRRAECLACDYQDVFDADLERERKPEPLDAVSRLTV